MMLELGFSPADLGAMPVASVRALRWGLFARALADSANVERAEDRARSLAETDTAGLGAPARFALARQREAAAALVTDSRRIRSVLFPADDPGGAG